MFCWKWFSFSEPWAKIHLYFGAISVPIPISLVFTDDFPPPKRWRWYFSVISIKIVWFNKRFAANVQSAVPCGADLAPNRLFFQTILVHRTIHIAVSWCDLDKIVYVSAGLREFGLSSEQWVHHKLRYRLFSQTICRRRSNHADVFQLFSSESLVLTDDVVNPTVAVRTIGRGIDTIACFPRRFSLIEAKSLMGI